MRLFYIFNIEPCYYSLCCDNPYNIYKVLEDIKNLGTYNYAASTELFETFFKPIPKNLVNKVIFNCNKDNDFYLKNYNIHSINNRYSFEKSTLCVKNAFLTLKSNKEWSSLLDGLVNLKYLFACDFQNKDYFWLDKVLVK